jgi:hypothetical protein
MKGLPSIRHWPLPVNFSLNQSFLHGELVKEARGPRVQPGAMLFLSNGPKSPVQSSPVLLRKHCPMQAYDQGFPAKRVQCSYLTDMAFGTPGDRVGLPRVHGELLGASLTVSSAQRLCKEVAKCPALPTFKMLQWALAAWDVCVCLSLLPFHTMTTLDPEDWISPWLTPREEALAVRFQPSGSWVER